MKDLGIYIHIPFCKKKCIYCDFLSFPDKYDETERYIFSLCEEIRHYSGQFIDYSVSTVFIGGGTPSSVDSKYIVKILETLYDSFKVEKECEITVEANPGTLSTEKLRDYQKAGINRLSMGLQSANIRMLNFLGRIHSYEQYEESVINAKKIGFKNINTDLIFGIPGQSFSDFKETLEKTVSIGMPHISAYSLIPEEGTPLVKMIEQGLILEPDDEADREMYHFAVDYLKSKGYEHYEISNFALKGYESKHNLKYWQEEEYLGVGLGAASFYGGVRYKNTCDFEEYIKNYCCDREEIPVSRNEQMNEFMMLGFRKINGPSPEDFYRLFGEDMFEVFADKLSAEEEKKLIEISQTEGKKIKAALTRKGLDFANEVFEEFI